jgi:hypothetical protein
MNKLKLVGTLEVRTTKQEITNGLEYEFSKTNLKRIFGNFTVLEIGPVEKEVPFPLIKKQTWMKVALKTENDMLYEVKIFLTKNIITKVEGHFADKFFAELTVNQSIHSEKIGYIHIFKRK